MNQQRDVSPIYYFWFPLGLFILLVSIYIFDKQFFLSWLEGERGFIELFTPVVLLPGIIIGFKLIKYRAVILPGFIFYWLLLVALACFYFAGEELSWGQQLFRWQTPEALQEINDQNETNLHNISSWFDQKPRLLLEIWVLIGGIILPLRRFLDKQEYDLNSWQYWFWPSSICFPSALIAIMSRIPERAKDLFDIQPMKGFYEIRYSEMQELYFAFFLSLYLASIYKRVKED